MTRCVSLEEIWNHLTENGKQIHHTDATEFHDAEQSVKTAFGEIVKRESDGNEYYDFYTKRGELAICDGETAEVLGFDSDMDSIMMCGNEGFAFELSKAEYDVGTFKDEKDIEITE